MANTNGRRDPHTREELSLSGLILSHEKIARISTLAGRKALDSAYADY